MKIRRVKLEGVKELTATLDALGPEIAERVGAAAVRAGAKVLAAEMSSRAPVNPRGPTKKNRADYGHLRDNMRVRRQKANKPYMIRFIVTTGRAFWGAFLEWGTVKLAARPWARPAFDAVADKMLNTIMETLRRGADRATKRLARGPQSRPRGIGDNGGPPLKD